VTNFYKRLYKFLAIVSLALSVPVFADQHKMKHIVISTDGELADIAEIMKQVEEEIGDENNVNVFVTIDDDGNVNITKSDAAMGQHHTIIRMKEHQGGSMPYGAHMKHGMHDPMNSGTANCILKNIAKAQTDSAARLIGQACKTLNKADE